jgi:threonine dehydratase
VVHPYDDLAVAAGQGTIGLEMLAEQPAIDTLLVAIGGGGLISGVATAVRSVKPDVHVIGVQTERFPAVWNAMHGQNNESAQATIADGIGVRLPGALTVPLIRERVEDVLLVGEDDIEQAILMLLEIEKTVVEGAGAVGLAALMKHRARFAGRKVGLILSGGNIEPLVLAEIIERGMVKSGRLARPALRRARCAGRAGRRRGAAGAAGRQHRRGAAPARVHVAVGGARPDRGGGAHARRRAHRRDRRRGACRRATTPSG